MNFFDDYGNIQNPDLHPKPALCLSCELNNIPGEYVICALNRLGKKDETEFKCDAYIEYHLPF